MTAIDAQAHSGTQADEPDVLTAYERAVCYYTVPKVATPFTLGLAVAYAVCFLEAVAALLYGLIAQNPTWTRAGTWALAGIVVLGIVAFFVRALINEVKTRRALATAHEAPDIFSGTDFDDEVPDPFAHHLLLRYPLAADKTAFTVTDRKDRPLFEVEGTPDRMWLKVSDVDGKELFRVRGSHTTSSFFLERDVPHELTIYQGDSQTARVERQFTFMDTRVHVRIEKPETREYEIRRRGIYHNNKLVGRLYDLRSYIYLDIIEDHFHDAFLGFFVALK